MAGPPTEQEPAAAPRTRAWSAPKSPVTRKQVDDFGRVAVKAIAGVVTFSASIARYVARVLTHLWRVIDDVPASVRVLLVLTALMLLGVVGSITSSDAAGVVCAVVVVPVCSLALGALGHRWYSTHSGDQAPQNSPSPEVQTSELARSIGYVDKKLTVALNSFGSERHQQAVIALFQAKTAVEFALGTEQDTATHIDEPVPVDDYGLRPRIPAGSASKSLLPENASLAAS